MSFNSSSCKAARLETAYLRRMRLRLSLPDGAAHAARHTFCNPRRKAAKGKLQAEADFHPCPTCGLIQPDLIARRRLLWHGSVTCIALLALLPLLIVGSIPDAACTDKVALIAAAIVALWRR